MESDSNSAALAALSELASEHKPLMDTIDELRRYQIDRIVDLPQIVVVGDQSCGKSSVLSAITRIPFPSQSTRFPVEVVLRTSLRATLGATIVRKDGSIHTLQPVSDATFGVGLLSGVITDAAREMGDPTAFSEDVLRVEISSPEIPHLDLVDLPGFCKSDDEQQTAEQRQLVERLAHKYMARSSSIILAVVAASNDMVYQSVLSKARYHDSTGRRTLGIITKPDLLLPGSRGDLVVRLARNNHPSHKLELGWHVLRNRGELEKDDKDIMRDCKERELLDKSPWSSLRNADRGVARLRHKLSNILLRQIQKNLPDLDESIQLKLSEYEERIRQLGDSRTHPAEMRAFLSKIASQYQAICSQAIEGNYSDPFFGGLYAEDEEDSRIRRLRALIRDLNRTFSFVLGSKGSKRLIVQPRMVEVEARETEGASEKLEALMEEEEDDDNKFTPPSIHEEEDQLETMDSPAVIGNYEIFPTSVVKRLGFAYNFDEPEEISVTALARELDMLGSQNQGNEFPGTSNDMLALHLFRDQIVPWEEIANFHVRHVTRFAKTFVEKLFSHIIADDDDAPWHAIGEYLVEPFFDARDSILEEKIEELLYHYKHGHPQPLDHEFASIYAGLKQSNNVVLAINALKEQPSLLTEEGRALLWENSAPGEDVPQVTTSSLDIIAKCETYYQLSIHTFINNVIVLALENGLIRRLPTIITTEMVSRMDDDRLRALASEAPSAQLDRADLQRDYEALKQAARALKPYRRRNSMAVSPLFGGEATSYFRNLSRPASRGHRPKSSIMSISALTTPPPEEEPRAMTPEPVMSESMMLQSPPSTTSNTVNNDNEEAVASVPAELPEPTTPSPEKAIEVEGEEPEMTAPVPEKTVEVEETQQPQATTTTATEEAKPEEPIPTSAPQQEQKQQEAPVSATAPAAQPASPESEGRKNKIRSMAPRNFLGSKKNRGSEQEAFRFAPKVEASSAISQGVIVSPVFAGPPAKKSSGDEASGSGGKEEEEK